MFSPYTPIPYHNNKITKYTHSNIDLVGFINENQLNVNDSDLQLIQLSFKNICTSLSGMICIEELEFL